MGHGSYTSNDWIKLKESRGINTVSSVSDIFKKTDLDERYDPRFINVRESCDSADSPESTPIIIGFDVTGSMGYLAKELATNAVNKTVTEIYEKKPVTNPHIMCAAFGNYGDRAPLQVTQFEADIRIAEQLFDLWIESGGSGYSGDSFVWYFAAKHTRIDSFKKRGKKGFIFTIGDDICDRTLYANQVKSIFRDDVSADLTPAQAMELASEKYEIFHIITKACRLNAWEAWSELIPGRVAEVSGDGVQYLAEIIISIMQIANGANKNAVVSQWPDQAASAVSAAIWGIDPTLFADTESGKKSSKGLFDRIFGR